MSKAKCADSYKPYNAVILAIDPGKVSGAALFKCGELKYHGPVDSFGKMQNAVQRAAAGAGSYVTQDGKGLPLVIVIERFVPHGKWSAASRAGLNENVGMWKAAIAELPKRRNYGPYVVRVYPQTWRGKLYSAAGPGEFTSDGWKDVAVGYVENAYSITTDHNTAEAILIGRWSCRAGSVGDVLPKRFREVG